MEGYIDENDMHRYGDHPALIGWRCLVCKHNQFRQRFVLGCLFYVCEGCSVIFDDPEKFREKDNNEQGSSVSAVSP